MAATISPAAASGWIMAGMSPDDIEKELGHPLPPEAKELLANALKNNANNAIERLKTTLPEGSEPCFTYIPTPRKKDRVQ